jgi:MFS family permease
MSLLSRLHSPYLVNSPARMNPGELRASLSLASIFGLRLFGMFVILPVFALWAEHRPGWDLTLVGLALGVYGFTQGMLQLPFGWISDRRGRKPVMYFGLVLFALGSFLCASSEAPWVVILGRTLQGAGAISGVAIATAADLTRDSQRSKAMAIIGSTIGLVFALSFMLSPWLNHAIGVPGIFALTGVLAVGALAVVRFAVPELPDEPRTRGPRSGFSVIFRDPELARLNVGIFSLHAVLMALFVVLPGSLVRAGLEGPRHGMVYLGACVAGFLLMVPAMVGPFAARERPVFLTSVALVGTAVALLAAGNQSLVAMVVALVIFFTGFNVLEAKLPALVSRAAPREATGAATGMYSSVQFLGTFVGGAAGGFVAQHAGPVAVLAGCAAVTAAWFAVAWGMGQFAPAA